MVRASAEAEWRQRWPAGGSSGRSLQRDLAGAACSAEPYKHPHIAITTNETLAMTRTNQDCKSKATSRANKANYQRKVLLSSKLITDDAIRSIFHSNNISLSPEYSLVDQYIQNWRAITTHGPALDFDQDAYIKLIGGEKSLVDLCPLAHAMRFKKPIRALLPIILFISHDASLTGAPAVLLELAKSAKTSGFSIKFIIGGTYTERLDEFAVIAPCLHVGKRPLSKRQEISEFVGDIQIIYANTVASAPILEATLGAIGKDQNPYVITHVHELKTVQLHFKSETMFALEKSNLIIAVSDACAESLKRFVTYNKPAYKVFPPFAKAPQIRVVENAHNHSSQSENTIYVYGCGTIEPRKGFDIFCEVAKIVESSLQDLNSVKFIWVGPSSNELEPQESIQRYSASSIVHCTGKHDDPTSLYKPNSIFLMTSREDPFPLVCIEAALMSIPVITFDERAGGTAKFVREGGCGLVANYLDSNDMAICVSTLLNDKDLRKIQGQNGRLHAQDFLPDKICPKILGVISHSSDIRFSNRLSADTATSVLVVSFAPPPIKLDSIVEGGSLRSWGIARGISRQRTDWNVTLAFPSWYAKDPAAASKGHDIVSGYHEESSVFIDTWEDEASLSELTTTYDVIVISYCHGTHTKAVISSLKESQILILDCNVPIYPEVCARHSPDLISEHKQYTSDSEDWNTALSRGDIFLCSNTRQLDFYYGILFSIGKINPLNYNTFSSLVVVPFGIDNKPTRSKKENKKDATNEPFRLLWFGGIYPWFNIEDVLEAVRILNTNKISCQLIIAGAINPFNNHPLFKAVAVRLESLSRSSAYEGIVQLREWIPFAKRLSLYEESDLAIVVNQVGIENHFSWRTRLMDYLENEIPFVTNGGDPVSDILVDIGLGNIIDCATPSAMANDLSNIINKMKTESINGGIQSKIQELKVQYDWPNLAEPICRLIDNRQFQVGCM